MQSSYRGKIYDEMEEFVIYIKVKLTSENNTLEHYTMKKERIKSIFDDMRDSDYTKKIYCLGSSRKSKCFY